MSRIINLVHDLVLRRDREAEQRENLVSNIRSLRAEESQRLLDLQRMQDKNTELSRALTTAEAQERTLKSTMRKAEAQAKELREQMLKMKSILDQVRAKCVSDVRKRDVELEKLKGHLAGMQRGKREASGIKVNVINPQTILSSKSSRAGQGVDSTEWSLEKETNDFLAALVNETSTENVSLRNIVTETMDALRELTDLEQEDVELDEDCPIGVPGKYRPSQHQMTKADTIIPCQTLANKMSVILDHCRMILKDPSFVPVEEVQIREEEIIKLRIGWEKMATRWKEAVTMMDNWRKRMLEGKEAFDVKELSNLEFGRSVAVMPNGEPVLGRDDELSAILFDHSRISMDDEHFDSVEAPVLQDEESDLEIPPEPSPKRLAASPARRGIKLPRPHRTLREMNSNTRSDSSAHPTSCHAIETSIGSLDGTANQDENLLPSKIPRAPNSNASPLLSVAEKLAAVEADAKDAEETRKRDGTRKRKALSKGSRKTGRRRSTLSPEELASLMRIR
jgi:Afadin- and alpha -actinin-Binding